MKTMKSNYHYEYRWRCVDMCNGGLTEGPYRTMSVMKLFKPKRGLWKIEKFRVYENNSRR